MDTEPALPFLEMVRCSAPPGLEDGIYSGEGPDDLLMFVQVSGGAIRAYVDAPSGRVEVDGETLLFQLTWKGAGETEENACVASAPTEYAALYGRVQEWKGEGALRARGCSCDADWNEDGTFFCFIPPTTCELSVELRLEGLIAKDMQSLSPQPGEEVRATFALERLRPYTEEEIQGLRQAIADMEDWIRELEVHLPDEYEFMDEIAQIDDSDVQASLENLEVAHAEMHDEMSFSRDWLAALESELESATAARGAVAGHRE